MDNKTFIKVLRSVYDRLYTMNDFEADFIRNKYFSTDDSIPLDSDVRNLYSEHIAVTRLCNEVHDLMTSIETFDL